MPETRTAAHVTKIETLPDGKHRWTCSCGKYGDPWIIRRDAETWAKMHVLRPNVDA